MAQNEEDTTCKICSHTQPTLKHWSLTTNIVTFCVAWIPNFLMHYPLTIFSTGFAPCLQSLLVATPSLSTTLHLSSSHASLVVSCPVPLLHLLGAVCSTSQSSRNESTHPKTSLNSPAWIIPSCLWRLNDDFRKVVPGGWEKLWKAYRQLLHPSTITSPFLGKKDDDTNSPKRSSVDCTSKPVPSCFSMGTSKYHVVSLKPSGCQWYKKRRYWGKVHGNNAYRDT